MIQQPTAGRIPSFSDALALAPDLAAAAARVHEGWAQVDGWDEELGGGGICDLVADALVGVLAEAGIGDALSMPAGVGENHVFVVALLADGVYAVDIPPSVYEVGSGYSWRKREGIAIGADDVEFLRLADPMDTDEFAAAYRD